MMKVKVLAVLGLCSALLAACDTTDPKQGEFSHAHRYTQIDRFGYVIANAFRVAHPEYAVTLGQYASVRTPGEMAIEVHGEPNWHSPFTTKANVVFDIRQDGGTGDIYFSATGDRAPIGNDVAPLDLISRSQPAQALAVALHRIGARDESGKEDVDEALKKVGRTKEVTAVVALKEPMRADDIRQRGYLTLSNAIFSSAKEGTPIYWDYRETWFCRNCGGNSDLVTSDFRSWVDSLEPVDDAALHNFGLSLDLLKKAARTGKIYGYIETDADPSLLRRLLKKNYVKNMYIVSIQKHCKDFDQSDCIPDSWPKVGQLNRH
jgi:hypothetical protein